MKSMEASQWDEAKQALQASIAMSDCLPQPWGNLGICLMMQERYDEAEEALKRALVIDPNYSIAKKQLGINLPNPDEQVLRRSWGLATPSRTARLSNPLLSSENSEVTVAKREKKNKPQLGKQPPRYRFFSPI